MPLILPLIRRRLIIDVVIGAALAALSAPAALALGPWQLLISGGMGAALALRRLTPALALAIAWAVAVLQMLLGLSVQPADLAVLGVLYAVGRYGERVLRRLGLVSALTGGLVAGLYLVLVLGARPPADVTVVLVGAGLAASASVFVLVLAWVLGVLARTRELARQSRMREAVVELERRQMEREIVVEQERGRVARDMHDIVAHSLAVVIAQADGARYSAAENPSSAGQALQTIATTAREALGEVRQLLGELRHDGGEAPQPQLADLGELLDRMRAAGLPVRWSETGERRYPAPGQQLAVYRVIQEGLTNALRHGQPGEPVTAQLAWSPTGLTLTLENRVGATGRRTGSLPGEAPAPAGAGMTDGESAVEGRPGHARRGHGLPGMRERATLAGGRLDTRDSGGVFRLTLSMPGVDAAGEQWEPGEEARRRGKSRGTND